MNSSYQGGLLNILGIGHGAESPLPPPSLVRSSYLSYGVVNILDYHGVPGALTVAAMGAFGSFLANLTRIKAPYPPIVEGGGYHAINAFRSRVIIHKRR